MTTRALTRALTRPLIRSLTRLPWYLLDPIGGVNPYLWLEWVKNRYALDQTPKSFSPLQTFTRATTAPYVDADGAIQTAAIDALRLDYSTGKRGLLMEAGKTNYIDYSDDFDTMWYKLNGATITSNQAISPDGTLNADLLDLSASSSTFFNQNFSSILNPGDTYTFSLYLRSVSGEGTWPLNWYDNVTGHNRVLVNLTEEWQRFEITFTPDISARLIYIYPGDSRIGTNTLNQAYAWRSQVEEGEVATSPIYTNAGAVTRTKDLNVITDLTLPSELTIIIEARLDNVSASTWRQVFQISDGNSNDNLIQLTSGNSTGATYAEIQYEGAAQATLYNTDDLSGVRARHAIRVADNNFGYARNGVMIGTDTSGTAPSGLTQLNIFSNQYGSSNNNGVLYDLRIYPSVLTDEELMAASQLTEAIPLTTSDGDSIMTADGLYLNVLPD